MSRGSLLDREYEYKAKRQGILPVGIFLVAACLTFTFEACTNNRAIELNGLFLPCEAATVFYWIAAVGFGLAVAVMIHQLMLVQRIVLTPNAIIMPKADWPSKEVGIPYATIHGVREVQGTSTVLMLFHRKGVAEIHASRFSATVEYEIIRQVLLEQVAVREHEES